jgi:hypothetical protein
MQRAQLLEALAGQLGAGLDAQPTPRHRHAELLLALDVATGLDGYRPVRVITATEEGAGYQRSRTEALRARIENEGRLSTLLWAWDVLSQYPDAERAAEGIAWYVRERYLRQPTAELPRGHAARREFIEEVMS